MQTEYLLFDGTSVDGQGQPYYKSRTISVVEAIAHFISCCKNPYSIGKVMILTDSTFTRVWHIEDFK